MSRGQTDPLGDALEAVRGGDISPVYLLVGERYPQELVLTAVRQAVLGGDENDFNLDRLLASEAGPSGILSAARTLPMLGPKRLVVVRDAHQLNAEQLAKLVPYVEDPNPRSCLVMLADKVDARFKLCQRLAKAGGLHRFEPLKDRQVPAWVSGEARRRGVKLAPGTAERVADSVGTDMGALAMALEQLSLYVGPGKPVRPEDVEDLLAQTRERSIFELTNAVGRGQRRDALLLLRRMAESQEPPVRIVAMLARHVRQLWSVKELHEQNLPKEAIASKVGLHPYFLGDMAQQAARMSNDALRRMHRALFEADRALKSSRLPDGIILQQLVLDLCPK